MQLAIHVTRLVHYLFKGPPIAKQIRVYKQYNLLDVEYPEVKPTRVEHPEGLKQRWRPFGWGKVLGGNTVSSSLNSTLTQWPLVIQHSLDNRYVACWITDYGGIE